MSNVVTKIATCFEQVAFFFPGGDPKQQESFAKRAQYLDGRFFDRKRLTEMLKKYHLRIGSGKKTFEHIAMLEEDNSVAVVTGQQAGLLTGPLYTLYKALTAIKLAEMQSKKLKRPVVPIFWIASEDHDWAEVRETYFLNDDGKPLSCKLKGQGKGLSIGKISVPAWEDIFGMLIETFPEGNYRSEVLAKLKYFTEDAENLAEWFAMILQWLLQDKGLVFFDPLILEFKQMAAPMVKDIVKYRREIAGAVNRQTAAWTELGFNPQVHLNGDEANLFISSPERRALLYDGERFYPRGKSESWTLGEIYLLLEASPEAFSPSVITRPVIQEYLLPTLAYVAGPGELNYWAQLADLFHFFDMSMPIVYPRLAAAIVTPEWQNTIKRENLSLEEIYSGLKEYKELCVREKDHLNIEGRFHYARNQISKAYEQLSSLEEIGPGLKELISQNKEKVEWQVAYLEKKIWQAQKKRCSVLIKELEKVEDGLLPYGKKQERILNPFSFIVRSGFDFMSQLEELPLISDFKEQIIRLK